MSWDTASKPSELANKSVGQTWQLTPNRYYLLRQVRATLEYPDLRRLIIKEAEEQGANEILIEDKGSGTGLIQELKRYRFEKCHPSIIGITPKDDKVMRMHAQTAKLEGQQVYLPQNAGWLDDFKNEVCAFPNLL